MLADRRKGIEAVSDDRLVSSQRKNRRYRYAAVTVFRNFRLSH